MTLDELIEKTEAKLRRETDANSYQALALKLATLKAAKDEDDEEDDEDEKKSKKSAKKSEEKKSEEKKSEEEKKASAKKSEEKKSEEDDEEEEEKKASKAALALIETATGRKGSAAIGAAAAVFAGFDRIASDTRELKANALAQEKSDLLRRASKYVQKNILDAVASQGIKALRAVVEEAEKGAPMVHTEEGHLLIPAATKPNTKEALPKDIQEMIASAVSAFPKSLGAEAATKFEAELVRRHLEDQAKALNGAAGVY